ncbi:MULTISPECIES: penicillin acylase family protein [Pseudonocardia]|uniref:Penicillin acylase 2 n=2 Tax=Pseudonocardia TaxID=1847 RepID=A0A1Y2MKK2_PSEAH|nr:MULTISPECIES: penicillin acylase family protein [Pseudonocardia]OSY35806.1 Penicillin acylase 2 precursor [Pseudonocardia autotrophica]TDN73100.1 penicillin amidase [Pseudonocardia autotrophica]BBG03820.1 penicillin amidase [Pseudonocardia autotrophica]GEC27381.1 penicillin amidase [Pseudonocardia saturnea]
MTASPIGSLPLSGLDGEVEIVLDRWGVPHIYAGTRHDAYLAQGFQAARDRLFQIDLWRRRGLGLLSEVFGTRFLAQDRATRLFLYRGDMRAEWLAYGNATRDVVTAFVSGVNAFVGWAMEAPDERLPPEFHALGHQPARWEPDDVVRIRTHGLLYNAEQELARALTVRDLGPAAEELRSVREPHTDLAVPDAAALTHLSDDVLDVYRLAFAPVDFTGLAGAAPPATAPSGSNNWVVAPDRTATGRPVLANDPHRAVTVPSLRYLTHLEAPGMSVIGAGEPNLPGVSIGHNGRVAFGLTIWPVDHEDLYVYELHPDDDTRYRHRDNWERFTAVEERTAVAGGAEETLHLAYTRHGPVIHLDPATRTAVAVRAVWLEPGMAPYLASLEYQDVEDVDGFRRALRRWGAPGVNQVFADATGDIGWQGCGLVPRRPGWDGALPVPGDGRFEWDGFLPLEELPGVRNPEAGWFSTSNEENLPEGFDNDRSTITTDWYSHARHERLSGWLDGDEPVDVEGSVRMQGDAVNTHGRRLLDRLRPLTGGGMRQEQEWVALQGWDGVESTTSRPTLVFQIWVRRHLRPWLVDRCLGRLGIGAERAAAARHRLLRADTLFSDLRPDLRMVEMFDLADEADADLVRAGVDETLGAALAELATLLGGDPAGWTWGDLHRTELRHAVFTHAPDAPERWRSLPSVARPGSGDTVGLTGHDPSFNAVMGSSFRVAVDVGEWDSTRVLNSPGQSGDPRSPHYADQLEMWGEGGAFPLAYTRAAVEDAAVSRLVLTPGTDGRRR